MDIEFGRPARGLWALDGQGTFLNHGSYGACPLTVLEAQDRIRHEMERQPDLFFDRRITPTSEDSAVRQVASALAEFVGVAGSQVALVESASTGVQAVLQSMDFSPGDEILITSHQYNAVRLAVEVRCKQSGAVPVVVHIPIPASPGDIISRIVDAAGPRVRLAIVDHITAMTGLVFPVADLTAQLRKRGIRVLIDGAHCIGQAPLDISALDADWYVANAHKWLYAPKGSAILYASEEAAVFTRPLVTSHFIGLGFARSFDYIGTRDYSAWLAMPAALAFFRGLGPDRLRAYHTSLVKYASDLLMSLGAQPVSPLEMCAAMRAFVLPQRRAAVDDDAVALKRMLWDEERIQVRADVLSGALLLRISAQAYVDMADLERLSDVLTRRGWPDR